ELLADRDPEDARKILDPVLELMMEAVHRYEGTVNQVMGDGIMALFGAPLAFRQHREPKAARSRFRKLLPPLRITGPGTRPTAKSRWVRTRVFQRRRSAASRNDRKRIWRSISYRRAPGAHAISK